MRIAVTGTPGTGKTTAVERVDTDLDVLHLNELIREENLVVGEDPERGSLVADLEAVRDRLAGRDDLLVESHLAHHLEADRVIVLRCHPRQLRERLLDRSEAATGTDEPSESAGRSDTGSPNSREDSGLGDPPRPRSLNAREDADSGDPPRPSTRKAHENAKSEALDVVLSEAVEGHGLENIYEIVTTGRDPDAVADAIEAVVAGHREPAAGTVDYLEYV